MSELQASLDELRAQLAEQQQEIERLRHERQPWPLGSAVGRLGRTGRIGLVAVLVGALTLVPAMVLGVVIAFNDVPPSNAFYNDIQAIAAAGVTTGCGGGNYCPKDYVTREQMAAFMNRLGALQAGKTPVVNAARLGGHNASYFASGGYSTGFTTSVVLTASGETHELMSLSVPSGTYVVIARLQGITGNDGGGNSFRYDCALGGAAGTIDAPVYRVGETNSAENYLTYEGGYSGAGPITLTCRSANSHTLTAQSGSMVAIHTGS